MSNSVLGMKYITEIKPGTYRISIRTGKSIDGKNLYNTKQISNTTLKEAQKLRDEMWKNNDDKIGIDGNIRVKDFARFYLQNRAFNVHTGSTYDGDASKIRNHIIPYIGDMRLKEITSITIQKLVNYLKDKDSCRHNEKGEIVKLSATTIKHVYNILSGMFTYAIEMKLLTANPCKGVTVPKGTKYQPVVYTIDEINELIKELKESNLTIQKKCIIILAMSLGARRGELAGITYDQIDLKNKIIYVKYSYSETKSKGKEMKDTKTPSGARVVGLNDIAVEMLEEHFKEQKRLKNEFGSAWVDVPNIFTNGPFGVIKPDSISRSWSRFIKSRNLKYAPLKNLRTSFATYLAYKGMAPKELQTVMGHGNYRTTMEYYQVAYDDYAQKMVQFTNDIGNK